MLEMVGLITLTVIPIALLILFAFKVGKPVENQGMIFHKVLCYVLIPLNILSYIGVISKVSEELKLYRGTGFEWVAYTDVSIGILSLLLCIIVFAKLRKFKREGFFALMSLMSFSIVVRIYQLVLYKLYSMDNFYTSAISLVAAAILFEPVLIYYLRRRSLFGIAVDYDIDKFKVAFALAMAFQIALYVEYLVMHIYFTYIAFTEFKLWFAIVTFCIPVIGDLMLAGALIANGIWTHVILFVVIYATYEIGRRLAEYAENVNGVRHVKNAQ